jgi:hypothetical protein
MSMVKRHAEAFEEMRHDLIQIALESGAVKLDDDGETLLTQCNADAERRAYARARPKAPADAAHLPLADGSSIPIKISAPHSTTSSARASSIAGTSRPSALAVFRLITSSYLVGCCTGRTAGLSPLRMRST